MTAHSETSCQQESRQPIRHEKARNTMPCMFLESIRHREGWGAGVTGTSVGSKGGGGGAGRGPACGTNTFADHDLAYHMSESWVMSREQQQHAHTNGIPPRSSGTHRQWHFRMQHYHSAAAGGAAPGLHRQPWQLHSVPMHSRLLPGVTPAAQP